MGDLLIFTPGKLILIWDEPYIFNWYGGLTFALSNENKLFTVLLLLTTSFEQYLLFKVKVE